jgi:hypothetical protein
MDSSAGAYMNPLQMPNKQQDTQQSHNPFVNALKGAKHQEEKQFKMSSHVATQKQN